MVRLAVTDFVAPEYMYVTVAGPLEPFDLMCHCQLTVPLPPTICRVTLNETGRSPLEHSGRFTSQATAVVL
jgi:hypothetical protein